MDSKNNYKPLLPNHKLKFFDSSKKYESDKYKTNTNKSFSIFNNNKEINFENWLNSPLHEKVPTLLHKQIKYRKRNIYDNNDNLITKRKYVSSFINQFEELLEKNNYKINNKKEFRDTISTFIYKLSN
jgi:hypothetical protein